jgi:hypothetical protein
MKDPVYELDAVIIFEKIFFMRESSYAIIHRRSFQMLLHIFKFATCKHLRVFFIMVYLEAGGIFISNAVKLGNNLYVT